MAVPTNHVSKPFDCGGIVSSSQVWHGMAPKISHRVVDRLTSHRPSLCFWFGSENDEGSTPLVRRSELPRPGGSCFFVDRT